MIIQDKMKLIGLIKKFNGKYGTIITKNNKIIDFDAKDISFNQNIETGDIVEFRLENKGYNIYIARNIQVIKNDK